MLDWIKKKKITIDIYGQRHSFNIPLNFKDFIKTISNQLQITPEDCLNNLTFKFKEKEKYRFFNNENEYKALLNYNSKNNIIIIVEFNEKTAEIIRESFCYNEKKNTIEIKDLNMSALINKSIKFKKDENKGMEEKIIYKQEYDPVNEISKIKTKSIEDNFGFEELDVSELNENNENNNEKEQYNIIEENNKNESNEDKKCENNDNDIIIVSPEEKKKVESIWNIFYFVNKIPGIGFFFNKDNNDSGKKENNENADKNE